MKSHRRAKNRGILAILVLLPLDLIADNFERPVVVNQQNVNIDGCGPCSIANFLLNGSPEMRKAFLESDNLDGGNVNERTISLIDRYCMADSRVRDGRPRFQKGISPFDVIPTIHDLQEDGFPIPNMASQLLIRGGTKNEWKDESDIDHIRRVHQTLIAANDGIPVILNFWQFEATKEDGKDYIWQFDYGHFITVLSVDPKIKEHAMGFSFVYADSARGDIGVAYAHVSERPYRANRWGDYSEEFIDELWPDRDSRGIEQWPSKKEMPRPYIVLAMPSRNRDNTMFLRKVCALAVAIYPTNPSGGEAGAGQPATRLESK